MRLAAASLLLAIAPGCGHLASRSLDGFLETHYVLGREDAWRLDGPYECRQIVSPTVVSVVRDGEEVRVALRGCLSTCDAEMDSQCLRVLSKLDDSGIASVAAYLRNDSTTEDTARSCRSVLYHPANRVFAGKDAHGVFLFGNLTYVCPQMVMIAHGYCLVDHSDTDYPLYGVLSQMEDLAKRAKRGYWGTARSP